MATTLCRVCLNSDIRLQTVSEIYLDTYEKLTNIKLSADTECGMPSTVCYICHRQLQRCHTFSEMARKSNRVLQEWLCNGTQVTNNALVLGLPIVMQTLVVTPTVHCSCPSLSNDSSTAVPVKEEQVSVKMESYSNKETSDYDDINTEECMLETLNNDAEINQHSNKTDSVLENDINAKTENIGSLGFYHDVHSQKFNKRCHIVKQLNFHTKKRYSCNTCDKSFRFKSFLKYHMRIHTGEKPFSCNMCNKTFSDKSNIRRHMRIHTGEKPFSCNRCNKTFSTQSNLTRHMHIHTGKKPFSCNRCDKMFSQKCSLTSHMRIHTGETPFSCNRCDKIFSQQSTLTSHMRIHTGETPFSCNRCDKMFSQKGNLTSHMRIHTGKKPFSCNRCDKMFIRKSTLTSHMRIHTGEKPFSCNRCNKTFSDKSTLTRHMRIHTG